MMITRAVNLLVRYVRHIIFKIQFPFNIIFSGVGVLFFVYCLHKIYDIPLRNQTCPASYWAEELDSGFEGFDNVSGVVRGTYIVPNYVHFLRYGNNLKNVNFMDAVGILAAFRNQKPDTIFFHTNLPGFSGKYWDKLMEIPGFKDVISFEYIDPIDSIFNQKLNSMYKLWHGSDILRMDILKRYGGIFIDNDVYIVQSLDQFRRFEMTLEIIDERTFGTMTLVAHKDARFLTLWLNSYKEYYGHLWYYNAGQKPKLEILDSRPELVHNVENVFGVKDLRQQLYLQKWPDWRSQYTIHTLVRHLHDVDHLRHNKLGLVYPTTFTDENILHYNVTILDMVLDCCNELLN